MKLTREYLRKLIKEQVDVLVEQDEDDLFGAEDEGGHAGVGEEDDNKRGGEAVVGPAWPAEAVKYRATDHKPAHNHAEGDCFTGSAFLSCPH